MVSLIYNNKLILALPAYSLTNFSHTGTADIWIFGYPKSGHQIFEYSDTKCLKVGYFVIF